MMVFLASLKSYIPQGYSFPDEAVELAFPLKNGAYYVAHGGDSPIINYHNTHPTQRYALDITGDEFQSNVLNWAIRQKVSV